jgi:uncharacterized membrane protein (DUF4010 family)
MGEIEILERLAVALAVGLVIGLERGWSSRSAPEGSRVAGLRTFALVGLAGGVAAVLGALASVWLTAAIAFGLALLLFAIRLRERNDADVGATTEVAGIVTFALGALAGFDRPVAAMAGAVATSFLLGAKPMLHAWVQRVERRELFAALQLLLISAVVLPLAPDRDFGPYGALNPYQIWWMVVLIAGLSFAGYLAIRILGARLGVLLSGLAGGLVSSTATTLQLSRRARGLGSELHSVVSAAILAACTVMAVRVFALGSAIHPPLMAGLLAPFGVATLIGTAAALWCWRRGRATRPAVAELVPRNPLDLRVAVGFAIVLAVVMVAARAAQDKFGVGGLYAVAAVSGLADVDAITLSIASHAAQLGVPREAAVSGLAIAAGVDTLVKAGLAVAFAPRTVARPVAAALVLMVLGGAAALAVQRGAFG